MDTGARSATVMGIRLPRYTPGKQTKGWAEGPSQLSVWKKSPKISSDVVCRKSFLSPGCLPIKCLCCSNPRPYDPKLCRFRGCPCNVIPTLPAKIVTACFEVLNMLKEYPTLFDYFLVVTSSVQEFTSGPPEVECCGDKGCHHLWYSPEIMG